MRAVNISRPVDRDCICFGYIQNNTVLIAGNEFRMLITPDEILALIELRIDEELSKLRKDLLAEWSKQNI